MLTDEQCNEFRRLPMSFNDMVALSTKPFAHRKPQSMPTSEEKRNAALEEAATYLETKRIITDNRVGERDAKLNTMIICYTSQQSAPSTRIRMKPPPEVVEHPNC